MILSSSSIRETAPRGPLQFQHGLSILLRPTHFPRQQGRNRIPTVAAKIDDAGRAEPAECRAKPTENNAEPESDRRKRTEGADAGPAFAEPEQAFAADLFATTVHLLDGY